MEIIPLALLIAILTGMAPVINKHILKSVDFKFLFAIAGIIYTFCMGSFILYHWNDIQKQMHKLDIKLTLLIAFATIFTAFITTIIYFKILEKHDSYIVTAIIGCSPVFTIMFAHFFLGEHISKYGFFGVLFIVLGIILLGFNHYNKDIQVPH